MTHDVASLEQVLRNHEIIIGQLTFLKWMIGACTVLVLIALWRLAKTTKKKREALAAQQAAILEQSSRYHQESLLMMGAVIDMAKSSRISRKEAELAKIQAETSVRTTMETRAGEIKEAVREVGETVPIRTADEVVNQLRAVDLDAPTPPPPPRK